MRTRTHTHLGAHPPWTVQRTHAGHAHTHTHICDPTTGMAGAPILTEKERKELEKKRAKAEKEKEKEIIKAEKERAKLLKQAAAEREKEEKRWVDCGLTPWVICFSASLVSG